MGKGKEIGPEEKKAGADVGGRGRPSSFFQGVPRRHFLWKEMYSPPTGARWARKKETSSFRNTAGGSEAEKKETKEPREKKRC